VPPSTLSLHGLARHLAGAERWWFRIQFAGQDIPMLYYSDDDPDQDFDSHHGRYRVAGRNGDPPADRQASLAAKDHGGHDR
jgi:hypothetical protein